MTEVILQSKNTNILYDHAYLARLFELSSDIKLIKIRAMHEQIFYSRLEYFIKDFNILFFMSDYPDEFFMVGDILNIVLDKTIKITEHYLDTLPIQIMLISNRWKNILLNLIKAISLHYGFHTFAFSVLNKCKLCIQFSPESRPIEFIIRDANGSIENEMDLSCFSLNKIAWNGEHVIFYKSAFESLKNRITEYCSPPTENKNEYNKIDAYRILIRDYKIKNINTTIVDLISDPEVSFYLNNRLKMYNYMQRGTFSHFQKFIDAVL
jgi:hypothetical protein